MKRSATLCLLAAAMVLAGCDDKKPANNPNNAPALAMKIGIGKGQSVTINASVPADLPAYAQLMPGAEVMSVIKMPKASGKSSTRIIYSVPDAPDAVIAFYKKLATDAGFETVIDRQTPIVKAFKAKAKIGVNYVAVNASGGDGKTTVNMSYK